MDTSLFWEYVTENIMIVSAVISALLPVRNALKRGTKSTVFRIAALLTAFVPVGAWISTQMQSEHNIPIFLCAAGVLAFMIFNVRSSLPKILYCFCHGIALAAFCTMYTGYVGAPYEDIGTVHLFSFKWGIICLAISLGVLLLFFKDSFVRLRDLLENENIETIWKGLLLIPLLITAFSFWARPLDFQNVMVGRVRRIILILFPIILLVYHLIIYILWWTAEHVTRETELKRQNDLLQIEEKRYNALRYYNEQARIIRHDFRHHMSVIKELLNTGKTDEARHYIEQFTETDSIEHKPFCRNKALDAIAAHYHRMALKDEITIDWKLRVGEQLPFREADLCSIVGNLLENAIHAAAQLDKAKRRISITMEMRSEEMLALLIRNPYETEILRSRNGMPRAAEAGHGIGLRSVASLVKAYNGNLQIETADGVFSVSIIMFAQRKKGTDA